MAAANKTTDHEVIKHWVESHGGHPATVKRTRSKSDVGLIRIDFPGFSGERSLQPISWDEWFEKFDEQELALLYQEGKDTNFNKLVRRDPEKPRPSDRQSASGGRAAASARSSKRSPRGARSTARSTSRAGTGAATSGRSAGAGATSGRSASGRSASGRSARAGATSGRSASGRSARAGAGAGATSGRSANGRSARAGAAGARTNGSKRQNARSGKATVRRGAPRRGASQAAQGNLSELSKAELYDLARSAGLEHRSTMNKPELVRALERQRR